MPTAPSTTTATQPTILVVGATGFLGAKVMYRLQQVPNITLKAMSRRANPAPSWVQGDLMNPISLDAALHGVDVVVSTANGYMKETIAADFAGNRNLIDAAVRAGVKKFVFLSIVSCDQALDVPHFHAKKVAEDLVQASGMPFIFLRAPAFVDQADDYVAKGIKSGRFYGIGDRLTRWSYVLTDDLANYLAQAAVHNDPAILNQTIDIGWHDGPHNQQDLSQIIAQITGKSVKLTLVPWWVLRLMVRPVRLFSDLGYDLLKMFLFFQKGKFVANTALQTQFFGTPPSAHDALTRWAAQKGLARNADAA